MIIIIDNLNKKTVTILKKESKNSIPCACAFMNSVQDREELKTYVDEKIYNEVLKVWGDTPTIIDNNI